MALLIDGGPAGEAVAEAVSGSGLIGPELLAYEVANVLRRLERARQLGPESASLAHGDLVDLAVQLWPYAALAAQAWRLRGNLTVYDGAYVALAARLDVPLVTLDRRLARAARANCHVVVPSRVEDTRAGQVLAAPRGAHHLPTRQRQGGAVSTPSAAPFRPRRSRAPAVRATQA